MWGWFLKRRITPLTALTIDATLDPNVSVFITCSTIASCIDTGVGPHVNIQVALMITEDRARNRRPRDSQAERTLHVIAGQFLQG